MNLNGAISWFWLAFILFWPCLLTNVFAFFAMLTEVNKKLPEKDRIRFWGKYGASKKPTLVRALYRQLYPRGWWRAVHTIAAAGSIIAMVAIFSL